MLRAVLALSCVLAGTAVADPLPIEIEGNTCVLDGLDSQIAQLLGRDPIAGPRVIVSTQATHGGLVALVTLLTRDGIARGPRRVTAPTCRELVASIAIVVAMALPDVDEPQTVRTEPTRPPIPATAPVVEIDETKIVRETTAEHAAAPELAVFASAAAGAAGDGVRGHVIVGARWRRGSRSLSAEIRADDPQHVQLAASGGVDVVRVQGSVSPCLHVGRFAVCALVSVGTIHGSGYELAASRSVYTPLLVGGTRVTWEHLLSQRVALRLHADLGVAVTTTEFDVAEMPVWRSQRFEGSAGVGVLARFP